MKEHQDPEEVGMDPEEVGTDPGTEEEEDHQVNQGPALNLRPGFVTLKFVN